MDKNKILEGNKLIASYMGMKRHDFQSYATWEYENGKHMFEAVLQYDSSWNWIMPVLDKINNNGCIVEISYSLVCMCRICVIGGKNERAYNIIHDNNGGKPPIEAVWKSIVEYLKRKDGR